MDDLPYNAHRAVAGARAPGPDEPEARFRVLVQSPLRAGLLRYLNVRPDTAFDVETLMQSFGRLRLDVENCLRELSDFGVARVVAAAGEPSRFTAQRPADETLAELLDTFLERRAVVSTRNRRRRSSGSAK